MATKKVKRTETEINGVTVRVGDIVENSWGYSMTIVDFAIVTEISPSGKTVKARRVHGKIASGGGFTGRVEADPQAEPFGPEFRLQVKPYDARVLMIGSYPFAMNEHDHAKSLKELSTHRGYFEPVAEGASFHYNTMD